MRLLGKLRQQTKQNARNKLPLLTNTVFSLTQKNQLTQLEFCAINSQGQSNGSDVFTFTVEIILIGLVIGFLTNVNSGIFVH